MIPEDARDKTPNILVYVDDSKVLQQVDNEEDVCRMQATLDDLHDWMMTNNMRFNGSKFVLLRFGQDISVKENTLLFSGKTDSIIEEKEVTRDLGLQVDSSANWKVQRETALLKTRLCLATLVPCLQTRRLSCTGVTAEGFLQKSNWAPVHPLLGQALNPPTEQHRKASRAL